MKLKYVATHKNYPGVYFDDWYYNKKSVRLVCTNEMTGFNSIREWKYRGATVPRNEVKFVWHAFPSNKLERRFAKWRNYRKERQEQKRHLDCAVHNVAHYYDIRCTYLKVAFYRFINWGESKLRGALIKVCMSITGVAAFVTALPRLLGNSLWLQWNVLIALLIGVLVAAATMMLLAIPYFIYWSKWFSKFCYDYAVLFDELDEY